MEEAGKGSTAGPAEGSPLARFKPDDPSFYVDDPDLGEIYQWLHEHAPVYWYEPQRMWVVSKWADVREVARDPNLFCSSRGINFFPIDDRTGPRTSDSDNDLADEPGAPPFMLRMDPPEHNVYRRLFAQAMTPRLVAALEPRIRQITDDCLKDVHPGDVVDLVEQLSIPVPLLVIAEMLGVPASDRADLMRWTDAVTETNGNDAPEVAEMFGYFGSLLAERVREPQDDLLSALAAADDAGRRFETAEILANCILLLAAGNDTTRNLVSGGVRALCEFPDEKAKLLADPSLIPGAVEEMLRWVSPVRYFGRVATADTQIRGQDIAKDDAVFMFFTAANRDAEIYAHPERFDVTRDFSHRPSVSFGWGQHVCIGANLARLEAKVMVEELLRRFPDMQLAGEPVFGSNCLVEITRHLPVAC